MPAIKQEKPIVYGADLEKVETFAASLKANPVRLGLQARAHWEGVCGRSLVHIGPFELGDQRIDRPTRQYTIPYWSGGLLFVRGYQL